jgi:cyclopropane-fatty-acyl-phospholipid synthase
MQPGFGEIGTWRVKVKKKLRLDYTHTHPEQGAAASIYMNTESKTARTEAIITSLLSKAGISINGSNPWDIQLYDGQFFKRVLTGGSMALGESYVDGWWDVESLDEFFVKLFNIGAESDAHRPTGMLLRNLFYRVFNIQAGRRAFHVGKRHYDAGNDLFEHMLDRRMAYSCAYWKDAADLDAAQEAKLDMICRKLHLQPGMRILDIGCGWGSLLKFSAENYSVAGLGITVSGEQVKLAQQLNAGLPVEVRLQDYRKLTGDFDAIGSVGMAEHVGWKNYPSYMKVAHRCLKPGGYFVVQTIGSTRSVKETDPWIAKYIFPNSMLPSLAQLTHAAEPYFVVEDVQNFGADYDRTLMAWDDNFRTAWPKLKSNYDKRFYRMWRYYLMSSAASFRTRRIQLWQLVLAKKPKSARYDAPR